MSKRLDKKPVVSDRNDLPAAELLSFLKEARGVQTWTEKELTKILRVGLPQAKEAITVLQLQGYIQAAGNTGKWRVTEQGEIASGAKPPRFTRQSVQDALAAISDRIKSENQDPQAPLMESRRPSLSGISCAMQHVFKPRR